MPSCRSPRAFLDALDLAALHCVASGNAPIVRRDHLDALAVMGLVVGENGRTALTAQGRHALNVEHDAQQGGHRSCR
jgi:hypothetical protein